MRSKSSATWLARQRVDPFTLRARAEGFRSRAAYKLLEIQKRDIILKQGMSIVDLGAAPGGWAQVAVREVGKKGQVWAVDILPIDPINNVIILQGDFREDEVLKTIMASLTDRTVDVVLSDMAPNFSGMKAVDQPRIMYLAELALDFLERSLKPGGSFLVKVFHGEGTQEYMRKLRQTFGSVVVRKPKASRPESSEIYLLAKDYIPSYARI